jgi:predicted Rossmann fold nucleotide-binding protein DprA/Smf involved in DNA uptake
VHYDQGMIEKIISGGQTGVDRAALDVALKLGISCGGWCPKGRKAEDGVIDSKYPLQEMESEAYDARTKQNILDSDGTLILTFGELMTGGTKLTFDLAPKLGKPAFTIDMSKNVYTKDFHSWIKENDIRTLNVGGPRESSQPGIVHLTASVILTQLFYF